MSGWADRSRVARAVIVLIGSAVLLSILAAWGHAYSALTTLAFVVGPLILAGIGAVFWWVTGRGSAEAQRARDPSLRVGLLLGVGWTIEITVNNVVAPPLPARDIFDDLVWAGIAIGITVLAAYWGAMTRSVVAGLRAGTWAGLASGLVACCSALLIGVVGMESVLSDPLNTLEWASRGASSGAPSMADYLAFELYAGAFLHLLVLGIGMGGVLGAIGGGVGTLVANLTRTSPRPRRQADSRGD